ncbi:MAG: hypothetical protein AAGB46_14195, partial [Verrucomicrobiota bacterium]
TIPPTLVGGGLESSMPKIMGGFHNMLLAYEAKNIKFRFEDGLAHAKELKKMADSFGIKGFYLNEDTFLGKERSIFSRLHKSPFYHLDELVVWELEHLEKEPDNKYAKHIHFEPETDTWRRRVVIQWNVVSNHGNQTRRSEKLQGLDLDTQFGFHESTVLHGRVHPNDFKDLKISYPIFIDRKKSSEEQIDYLQRAFVKNLRHIYDPFSWGARRDTRFQTGLARELRHHLSERGYKVTNREWFDPVISNFLNDVVYIQRHGYQSLYAAIARRATIVRYQNQLGDDIDLLNWEPEENRKVRGSRGKPRNPVGRRLNFETANGARYILLDAYLRNGDKFLDGLRTELLALKKKEDPIPLFKKAIADVTGIPAEKYIELATVEQRKLLAQYQQKILEQKEALASNSSQTLTSELR